MLSKPNKERSRRNRRRGAAVVELAVCLPVLVLLTMGAIEACTVIYLKKSLTVAAYEAGRTALMPGATSVGVMADCQQVLTDREVEGAVVTLTPLVFETEAPGAYLEVSISAPCDQNTLFGPWFYSNRTISTGSTFRKEF